MQITVKEKSVYGNILVYPVCDTAKKLSSLINKATFSHRDLTIIESLGYVINVVSL